MSERSVTARRPGATPRPYRPAAAPATAAALLLAAVGIVVQILFGADYPVVPPGAGDAVRCRGIHLVRAVAVEPRGGRTRRVVQIVGLFPSGQSPRLVSFDPVGDSLGLWLQMLALTAALVTGTLALVRGDRTSTSSA